MADCIADWAFWCVQFPVAVVRDVYCIQVDSTCGACWRLCSVTNGCDLVYQSRPTMCLPELCTWSAVVQCVSRVDVGSWLSGCTDATEWNAGVLTQIDGAGLGKGS